MFLGDNDLLPHMFMHVYNRIRLVGDPFSDPYNQGFQMIHSYYALFNGGLTGLGLGNSITKKAFYQLRKPILFFRFSRRAWLAFRDFCYWLIIRNHLTFIYSFAAIENPQIGLILLGTSTLLLLQTSINIASILGLMPMTGYRYHLSAMVAPVTLFFHLPLVCA